MILTQYFSQYSEQFGSGSALELLAFRGRFLVLDGRPFPNFFVNIVAALPIAYRGP